MQIEWRSDANTPALNGREPEWLVTNGIGGFACGTIPNIHRRRYHGLLTASLQPPVERRLLWVKNDEWLVSPAGRWPLATNDYGDSLHPDGWRHLHSFSLYPFPTTVFLASGIMLQRTVFMVHGQNTTVLIYRLLTHAPDVQLHMDAFVNCRDYHHTTAAAHVTGAGAAPFAQQPRAFGTAVTAYSGGPELVLGAGCTDSGAGRLRYDPEPTWFYRFHYALERERGLDYVEDHFRPGVFRWRPVGAGDVAVIVGHCPVPAAPHQPPFEQGAPALLRWALEQYERAVSGRKTALLQARAARRRRSGRSQTNPGTIDAGANGREVGAAASTDGPTDPDWDRLVLAADAFIVRRQTTGAATVLAGYPWFTDWGRDAMISLPGLLLTTGRFNVAKEVLLTFAHHRADGLIPNRFPDDGGPPLYNTVDASLWFIWALWNYATVTGDVDTVRRELLPVAEDIIHHYVRGTRHGIGIDADGLVRAAHPGLQLTWMDAKAGDWVVTPRAGLPVEINALWYNALRTVATLAEMHAPTRAGKYRNLTLSVRRAFLRRFVRRSGGLYDVVAPNTGASRRPQSVETGVRANQIFAASLPYPVLGRAAARRVVEHVARHLLTPVGLRTLAADDPAYVGVYEGDQVQRDAAYHQGTVWPWLLGPFVSAWRQSGGRARDIPFMAGLRTHLRSEAALGHVSEIFTGNAPHEPRGCFAQAWSVAEWLRVWDREAGDERGVGARAHAYGSDYRHT